MPKKNTTDQAAAPVTDAPTLFRNRIVPGSLGVKPADQFTIHPLNAKYHPEFQRRALKGALKEVGFVGPVIESLRTGYLLDGHERVWVSLETNELVPFIVVDVSEEEEKYILATLDPLGWLSSHTSKKVGELLAGVSTGDSAVQDLLSGLTSQGGAVSSLLDLITEANEPDDSTTTKGDILEVLSVTLADPVAKPEPGGVYKLGRHVLLCMDVVRDWSQWVKHLDSPDCLFCPHAGMFVFFGAAAREHKLVIVQPDQWIAGHIIDRYREVYGDE